MFDSENSGFTALAFLERCHPSSAGRHHLATRLPAIRAEIAELRALIAARPGTRSAIFCELQAKNLECRLTNLLAKWAGF